MDNLHALPKFRDGLSTLYVEHARIDRHEKSIAVWDAEGCTPVPAASLLLLMLGPGVNITHSAITTLADNNCLVVWSGEQGVRFYAYGSGGTRSAYALLRQARLASDEALRLEVVKRMYRMRFPDRLDDALTVEQWRGLEGVRVRDAYARLSKESGVEWVGRSYDRSNWANSDPVNRSLSCANACLYGICHAAIVTCGYSPAIGFVHTGKQLSFVYDIADFYKVEFAVPIAFQVGAENPGELERRTRLLCRDKFRETKLLQRIIPDIQKALGVSEAEAAADFAPDADQALPTELWTPDSERQEAEEEQ